MYNHANGINFQKMTFSPLHTLQ